MSKIYRKSLQQIFKIHNKRDDSLFIEQYIYATIETYFWLFKYTYTIYNFLLLEFQAVI